MAHNKTNRYLSVMAFAVALLLFPQKSIAQHNNRQIDDEVYALYDEGNKKRLTDEGLKILEQAYELAVKKGDKKAQCLTLCERIFYYYKLHDAKGLKAAIDRVMKVAKENKNQIYYYFAWAKWIEYNVNERDLLLALQEAQKMSNSILAERVTDHYTIASSYRTMANVYWGRLDYDQAAKYYQMALDHYLKYLPKQDPSNVYMMLTKYYLKKKRYKQALETINEGIVRSKTSRSLGVMYMTKSIVCYWTGDKDAFYDSYAKVEEIEKGYGEIDSTTLPMVKVMKHLLDGNFDEARRVAATISYKEERLECQRLIVRAQDNSKEMYDITDKLLDIYIEDFAKMHAKDVAELNRSVGDIQFKADKLQLELELATSNSAKERMERDRLLGQAKMKDLENANYLLKLNETKTSDSLNRAKLAIQEQKLAAQKEREEQELKAHQLHIAIFALVLTFLIALLANAAMNRRNQQKLIKKLRQSNTDLEIAKEKAEESSRMKSMFVQNVSHEIRTPLNAIVGFADLLANPDMELGNDEKMEFNKIIHTNTELLTGLVNDILVLSELQSGKAKTTIAKVNCNSLCKQAIDTVMHRKPEGVEFRFTTDAADDFEIETDSRRLSQVVINFLTNAAKYTTEGSITLDCSTKKQPGQVVFSVTDTGCGIPLDKQAQIFDRFEKLDDFHQGMGLGLNICAMIADLLDGEIGIDKDYTDGARFYISIPATHI